MSTEVISTDCIVQVENGGGPEVSLESKERRASQCGCKLDKCRRRSGDRGQGAFVLGLTTQDWL